MQFDSLQYLAFLGLVWIAYWRLGRGAQNWLLLGGSYLFYACWDVRFLTLIWVSTFLDYVCGQMLGDGRIPFRRSASAGVLLAAASFLVLGVGWEVNGSPGPGTARLPLGLIGLLVPGLCLAAWFGPGMTERSRRRTFLLLSLGGNLGLLAFFKYYGFFVTNAEALAGSLGMDASALRLDVVLPVGISFYTFQTLSYTLDVHAGRMRPVTNLRDFALYVSFFPQLVAGPIERGAALLPQLAERRDYDVTRIWSGLHLILLGLVKKVAIADAVAKSVNAVYGGDVDAGGANVAVATVLFAVQIYCDFSGYTDIARGSARLFSIELRTNFEQPYFSRNPSEFWKRWHVSLSTWLRDYLYIPLGGNRVGALRTYRNLMLTMLLGGLWHGAAWNFVLWGGYQGALLCTHRALRKRLSRIAWFDSSAGALFSVTVFFGLTCYGWLLFRAVDAAQIGEYTLALLMLPFDAGAVTLPRPGVSVLLAVPLILAYDLGRFTRGRPVRAVLANPPLMGLFHALLFLVLFVGAGNDQPQTFIYFQF